MLKFSIEKFKVVVDPASLTLSCLRDIWMDDRTKTKEEAIKLLTYIHICSQLEQGAPFYKADPTEVGVLVKNEIYGSYEHKFKKPFDEEYVDKAIFDYQTAYEGAAENSVRVFDKKIHELNRLIDRTKIEITKTVGAKGDVIFSSNFTILNKMMQDSTKIQAARDAMYASILKQAGQNTVRGQKQVSFLEKKREKVAKALSADAPDSKEHYTEDEDEEETF